MCNYSCIETYKVMTSPQAAPASGRTADGACGRGFVRRRASSLLTRRLLPGGRLCAFHRRRAVAAARHSGRPTAALRFIRARARARRRAPPTFGIRRAALASASTNRGRRGSYTPSPRHAKAAPSGSTDLRGSTDRGARASRPPWPPGACAAFDEDRGPHDEACTRRSSTS